jgi:Domain of Unknown Function (DUF349)
MSLFSRLFRKAPQPAVPPAKPPENFEPPRPAPNGPDRAVVASREAAELETALEARDTQTIGRLVLEGSSTKIRQQAAQAVQDLAQLRQLIKDVRGGNDKSVYKILTGKRDALLIQARQREQLEAEIGAASTALERHSHRAYDALFTPTLEQHQARWNALAPDADPQTRRKVQDASDRAHEVIAQHLRQIAVEASRELAAANAAAEAQRQRELAEKAAAIVAAERAQIIETERKALAEKQEAEAVAFRQIGGLVRKAHSALSEGSTGRAAGLRRAIEDKLPTAPPLPLHLTTSIQLLDKKLEELKDWKSFSVAPKRVELMEEMESLIGATIEPAALADRIKSLQEEWRTLSKGAGENVEADWQRFQEAAQKAYQPCREYFEAQSLVRQENLQRRAALLERLNAFETGHNWEQPDWRTVIVALRESKQEWRTHSPVDRAAGKSQQQQFETLTRGLQARLDAQYARNVKEKQLLVERAQRLVAAEDSRKAIDEAKVLQQKWKEVGLTPRDEGQRLWEEFRQHCDAVFAKRQQEYAEHSAGLETNKSKAVAACAELEKIAALSGAELLEGAARIAELRVAFDEAGELPRSDERSLRMRFERALERCERAVIRQEASNAERSWVDLLDAADRVRAYLAAIARDADESERGALKQAAEDYVLSVRQWPKGGLEAVKKALARGESGDFEANETVLRTLCIRAEILTDLPTPPEDQTLRREYQVQRLMQGMGQGITADEKQLDAMTIEWVGIGPTDEGVYQGLLGRFKRCRERGLARSG